MKRVKRNMENTHPFLRDGTATTSTEIRWRMHWMDWAGHHAVWQNCLGKSSHTSQQKLREFEIQNIGYSKIESGWCFSNREINNPTLLKRKENARDHTTNKWQGPSRKYRTIPRSQQVRQRKEQAVLKELKNTTMQSILERAGGSIN